MFTTLGKSGLALLIAGSGDVPRWCAIGSGSGVVAASNGSLVAETQAARVFYSTRDISTARNVVFTFDYGASTMSGTAFREFGVGTGSAVGVVNLWSREGFPAITFDGTNELQIEVTYEVF